MGEPGDATAPTVASERGDVSHEETLPASATAPGAPLPTDATSLATVPASAYTILGEHGRGGLGRILRARDERTGRVVAIKEIVDGNVDAAARFVREALVTANLQHPAIVPVYEVGRWPSGQPFYAMKLVAGRTLSAAITDARDLRARLALVPHVAAVADALAYAHEAGVIHRDLKPSNVLVGAFGETVVIDWGLAKRTGDDRELPLPEIASSETQSGSVMGTPAYMPPEQAIGEAVDARADVYAIGAMLYHLLAGAPPYADSKDAGEVITRVRTGKPPAPLASLVPDVAPDLAAIVEKAMARAAGRRYPSAAELAADLRAFMNGGLVGAHRYTRRQRVARWIRRHRAPVAVALLAALALGAFGTYSIARIVSERDRARAAEAQSTARLDDAEELASFMLRDQDRRLRTLGRLDLLEPVAREAIAHYARARAHGDPPSIGEAEGHQRLGEVFEQKGDYAGARAEFEHARDVMRAMAAGAPWDLKRARDLAVTHNSLGDIAAARGDGDAARAEYQVALDGAIELTHRDPDQQQFADDIAFARRKIGGVLESRGDVAGALEQYRAARAITAAHVAAQPGDLDALEDLSDADAKLGDALVARGDTAGALTAYDASRAEADRLVAARDTPANRRVLMVAQYKLARVHRGRDEYADAATAARAAIAIAQRNAARDPANANWQRDVELTENELGDLLRDTRDLDGAAPYYANALAAAEALVAAHPDNADWQYDLTNAHDRVGDLERRRGHAAAAAEHYRAALAIRETFAARHPEDADWQRSLSISHSKIAQAALTADPPDPALAVREASAAVAVTERLAAADPTNLARAHDLSTVEEWLGNAQLAAGDHAAAAAAYRRALELATQVAKASPGDRAAQVALGVLDGELGDALAPTDAKGARLARQAALAILEPLAATAKDPEVAAALDELRRKLH